MRFKLPEPIGNETQFTWGPVVKLHKIEALDIVIVEYHEEITKDGAGTGKYEETKTTFQPFVEGKDSSESVETLEQAIIISLAIRKFGKSANINGRYAYFACKILDLL